MTNREKRTTIAILGFGREGHSVLKFLQNRKRSPTDTRTHAPARRSLGAGGDKEEIWVLDKDKNLKLPRGVRSHLGPHYLEHLAGFDVIFRSPGIPYLLPQIQAARKHGAIISSATKLFFSAIGGSASGGEELSARFPHHPPLTTYHLPVIIGITGTKGKGTTCTLLYKMLKSSGKGVHLAGNIGTPALNLLRHRSSVISHKSFIVLELSSFQLQDLEQSPHIAAVLDVFPDHQDAHKSLAEYYRAKANIARHQKKSDAIFFFTRNALSRAIARKSSGKRIGVDEKKIRLFDPGDVRLVGAHNFKNAVMAATIAQSLGVPRTTIKRVVKSFKGNEHRLEHVRTILYSNVLKNMRISFYNDSASTIPQPTAAALRSFPGENKILIAGGRSKVHEYSPIRKAIDSETKLVILIGENKKEIARAISKTKVPCLFAKTLRDAVRLAYRAAKSLRTKPYTLNPVILFSPGSASFDMFKDYAARGKKFKKLVRELKI